MGNRARGFANVGGSGGGGSTVPVPTGTGYLHITGGAVDGTVSDWIGVGTTLGAGYVLPSTGLIRLPNSQVVGPSTTGIVFRNIGNSADMKAMSVGADNYLNIGSTDFGQITFQSGSNIGLYGGSGYFFLANTSLLVGATMAFDTGFWTVGSNVRVAIGGYGGHFYAQGTNTTQAYCLAPSTGTPTIAAGAAAGTSPTVSVAGDDMSGVVTVTTGTATTTGTLATITFVAVPFSTAPHVMIQPAEANAWGLTYGQVRLLEADITTGHWVLKVPTSALTASTTYKWTYRVTGG